MLNARDIEWSKENLPEVYTEVGTEESVEPPKKIVARQYMVATAMIII